MKTKYEVGQEIQSRMIYNNKNEYGRIEKDENFPEEALEIIEDSALDMTIYIERIVTSIDVGGTPYFTDEAHIEMDNEIDEDTYYEIVNLVEDVYNDIEWESDGSEAIGKGGEY